MRCPKCGSEIDNNAANCDKCGTPIIRIKPMRVCTNCGSEVPDTADTCPGCGRTIKRKAHQTETGQRSSNGSKAVNDESVRDKVQLKTLKKDRYAWMQSIIPGVAALLYHWLVLRNNMSFNIVNTVIIFEALVFYFGYHDIKELDARPEMMEGLVYSKRFIYLTYFLPILSLWERKQLPGMDCKALYPLIHAILFTLLVLSIIISMDAQLLASMNTSHISL